MKLHEIPDPLLEAVLERFLERSRGTVKRWRRWGMLDLASIYYSCHGQYHLNIIAVACTIVQERAKKYCKDIPQWTKVETLFIENLYTEIEKENTNA